jgi:hypothetical protein
LLVKDVALVQAGDVGPKEVWREGIRSDLMSGDHADEGARGEGGEVGFADVGGWVEVDEAFDDGSGEGELIGAVKRKESVSLAPLYAQKVRLTKGGGEG